MLNVHTPAMLESSQVCPYNKDMTQRVTDMPNEILDSDNIWDSDLLWTYNGRKLAIYCSLCRNNERVYARKQVLCFHHLHMHCAWRTRPAGKTTNFCQQRYNNASLTEVQTT